MPKLRPLASVDMTRSSAAAKKAYNDLLISYLPFIQKRPRLLKDVLVSLSHSPLLLIFPEQLDPVFVVCAIPFGTPLPMNWPGDDPLTQMAPVQLNGVNIAFTFAREFEAGAYVGQIKLNFPAINCWTFNQPLPPRFD